MNWNIPLSQKQKVYRKLIIVQMHYRNKITMTHHLLQMTSMIFDHENESEYPFEQFATPKKGISKTDHHANASQQDNDDVPLAANDIDDI